MRDVVCYALVTTVLFAQLAAFGANDSFLATCAGVAEILVCLVAILVSLGEVGDRPWEILTAPLSLFVAALAWGAAPLALNAAGLPHGGLLAPDGARVELVKLAGLGAMALTGVLIARSRTRFNQISIWLAVAGLAYTLVSLWLGQSFPLAVFGQSKGPHTFRFTGTFLNANAAGCMFGMIGLFSMGLMQRLFAQTDLRTSGLFDYLKLAAAGACALAAFGACVLTESRTSLVLSLILGGTLIGIDLWRRGQSGRTLGVAAAAILLVGLGLGASQIASRWSTTAADAAQRFEAYRHYLSAIWATPWFGFGLGGFKAFHESTLSSRLAPSMWDYGAAHSALVQATLEGGAPFVVLLLGALGLFVRGIFKRTSRRELGPVVSGALAAAALAFTCSFVDIALNVPAVAAFTALLLGLSWGVANAPRTRRAPAPPRKAKFAMTLGAAPIETAPALGDAHG